MNNKILITGAAGFIGFHISKLMLEENYEICGVDNINNYYSISLKNDRLSLLKKYPNFKFNKVDISNYNQVSKIFKKFQPEIVINLAAQAGVRYSIENPFAYVESNLIGFVNIIELCRKNDINGLIYASSSSVYGENKKIPFDVNDRVDMPMSIYAASKRANELIAHSYSHLFNLNTTGLRFFTVYGPLGRPDMAMYLFADKISSGSPIQVFNNGNMKRDFTYIDDIANGIKAAVLKNYKCEIFNLGNSKSENLMDVVREIEYNLNMKAEIEYLPIQRGDVVKTYANIDKSIKMLDYQPTTNVKTGIKNFITWYKKYNNK